MLPALDPAFIVSNRIEAVFWIAIAIAMIIAATRQSGAARIDCFIAAIAFAFFGLSDLVETKTGAWWRPWWLLVWKATCVLALLVLLARYLRRRKLAR
jgi:hypothetical protein